MSRIEVACLLPQSDCCCTVSEWPHHECPITIIPTLQKFIEFNILETVCDIVTNLSKCKRHSGERWR